MEILRVRITKGLDAGQTGYIVGYTSGMAVVRIGNRLDTFDFDWFAIKED